MTRIATTLLLAVAFIPALASCDSAGKNIFDGGSSADQTLPQATPFGTQAVKPGIQVLAERGFTPLKGKRVGLITNPTGVDNTLRSTIDILASAPGVTLTALFAPEHGVRGNYGAGEAVPAETDPATGVKVYSLHGPVKAPTAAMLANVDVLVYDIQDIGCRSYTFISTMGKAMEAAARAGKEFMVLDRPNPVGGFRVEGGPVDPDCRSFVSQYNIPYLYGLTPGELARVLNEEGLLDGGVKCALSVIPMEGWHRAMTFSQTGMPWVLPSPHIPYPMTAEMYPSTGIMGELDYVSIGCGYTLPFCLTGAPWIDADSLASRLTALEIPGVEFRPLHYKPYYALFSGKTIHGVQIYVRDPSEAPLTLIQFYIMQELASLYPDHKAFASATANRLNMFDKVSGSKKVRAAFGKAYRVDDILPLWMGDFPKKFKAMSEKYYLYE